MSEPTIFDKFVSGEVPCDKVWENDGYLAFLTPWPSTPGFTVVIPKKNPGDNYLDVDETAYTGLLVAARHVGAILRKAFNCYRVGLVMEGEGVPYMHAKLIPMHGVTQSVRREYEHPEFFTETYKGFLSTGNGPKMDPERLREIQAKIQAAAASFGDVPGSGA
jgi:histidine triad (HIT) family protein